MNPIFVPGLTILAASMSPLASQLALAGDACEPHVVRSDLRFPERSQQRGQAGIVFLDVLVDENGHARSVELQRSSGYRLLDRDAAQSAGDWLFDVSGCARAELPVNHVIAVEYRASAE